MRYGAVDIGTNSCRLLIAEQENNQKLKRLARELETTRIGEGINLSPLLKEEAMARTLDCLSRFSEKMREYEVDEYKAVATSAVRGAENGAEFVRQAEIQSGMAVAIVSEQEEARLSYEGVRRELELTQPPLVIDLGGGSTEFICPDQDILLSVPLGAVRAAEADMSAGQISDLMKQGGVLAVTHGSRPVVMVGGTASSLAAIKKGLPEYDPELVHGEILSRGEIGDLYNLLERMPLALRRRLPGLQPERADIINKGALIILIIMEILGQKEIIVSESDLLEGIIWSLPDR
jgi:exopolyphosphatase/guanosine-5'-triphosphate,3'-diphosphate pyrophosphatase